MVAIVGGGGHAGVVWHDPETGADGQRAEGDGDAVGRGFDEAVLLMHIGDPQTLEAALAGGVIDQPVAHVLGLARRRAILGKRQAAGVDEQHAEIPPVADDRGQHGQRDVVEAATAEPGLERIVEHIDAGTGFGDALESAPETRRRRGSDADLRTGEAGIRQAFSGANHGLAFGLGAGMAMNQPVRTSIIPNLVEKKDMMNAMSLNSIAINSTRFVGPAAIAALIAATEVGWAYVWAAGALVVVVWTTSKIAIPNISSGRSHGNAFNQLMEGFVYIGRHRVILALVLLGAGPLAIGFSHQVLLPQLVEEQYGRGIGLMGIIQSAGAIGGLSAGIFIASRREVNHKGRLMLMAATSYGVALLAFSGAVYMWMAFPLIIWIGGSQTIFRAGNSATLMELAPDHLRGRIISATLIDTALAPLAGLAAGVVADRWGVSAGYMLLSAGCLGIVALVMLIYPKMKDL